MASEEVTVGVLKDIIYKSLGQEDEHTAWFELSFDSSPLNVIVNKTVISEISNNILAFCVSRQLTI